MASIVAWGGVGKSAVVNAWLRGMDRDGWRGAERVFGWSFYSQGTDRLSSSDEFVDVALQWFGDSDPTAGSPWDKGERLAALVRRERTILVLDGVEPLQWGPGVEAGKLKDPALQALVKELGAQNRGLCLIATRIAVADLDGVGGDRVEEHRLERLSVAAGAELLKARGAKGADEDLHAAAEEYEGHGLALTLLGGYIRKRYRGDVRQRVRIPVLEGRPAQRMMGIYERWFAGKPEIAILRMLGLFDRPAGTDEIAALRVQPPIPGLTMFLKGLRAGAWNEAVTTLRDAGLLAPDSEGKERLDAHPLVREYFADLMCRDHAAAWREGHRRLYEHLRRRAKELPKTTQEMAPLYAAVVHGCRTGKNKEVFWEVLHSRIHHGGDYFSLKRLGSFGSEVTALSAFFDPPWERLVPGLSDHEQALILGQAGFVLRGLGRLPEAASLMQLALEHLAIEEDWDQASAAASNLSQFQLVRGELREALMRARQSTELADKIRSNFQLVVSRSTLAASMHAMGLRGEAATQFKEAERMHKERQPDRPLLVSLQGFLYCDFLLEGGLDAHVRTRVEQAMKWFEHRNSVLDIALNHLSLGRAHLLDAQRGTGGALAQAVSHLDAAVDGLRRAGTQHHLPLGLLARAALHTHTRAFDLARKDLTEALTLATRCGFRLHECDAHLGLARLALAEGPPSDPRPHLTRARTLIEAIAYHRRDAELADLERRMNETNTQ